MRKGRKAGCRVAAFRVSPIFRKTKQEEAEGSKKKKEEGESVDDKFIFFIFFVRETGLGTEFP